MRTVTARARCIRDAAPRRLPHPEQRVPTMTNNPLLHTLCFHEVGTILGTEEA